MQLTENDIAVLRALATYYLLSASMVHEIVFPQNSDRRGTRRRLQRLVMSRYIARSSQQVSFSIGNAGPVYYLTDQGASALAVYFDDPAFLRINTHPPRHDRLYHWLDIAHAHWVIRQACELSPHVELVSWINEWQPLLDLKGNLQGFALHTQFREVPTPLSCSPDAGFLVRAAGGHERVFYAEIDRGTTAAKRVAASKMAGFAELLATQGHRRHFPSTTFEDFSVLVIAPNSNRRNILQHCVAQHPDMHPELWIFADQQEFRPERALHAPIILDIDGDLGPLVNLSTTTQGGAV